jgi:hypothetical protein
VLKDQISQFIPQVWAYFESQIVQELNKLPEWFAKMVADVGLSAALDYQWLLTEKYIDKQVVAEMKAMSQAAGVSYATVRRVHMIGEITRGRCSMFGSWGEASADGKTIQLRALDWDVGGPLQNFATVVVYHPLDASLGHAWTNVAWAGYIGTLTGMSSLQLGVSEIGVSFPDSTFGDESMVGTPFVFLLREVLQYDKTLDDALTRMANAKRTCRLILGVGDGKLQRMNVIQYSHSVMNIFDDKNLAPVADWHPRINNIVYEGMDWLCPAYQQALHDNLVASYGKISPQVAIQDIVALTATGDLHVALYDLTDLQLYVANARGSSETGPLEAYNRQYVHFDMKTMYSETP